jgi:hypothetical protein
VTPASTPADIAARGTPSIVSIRTENSLGTGFVVRKDGWIATNLHVLVGGEKIVVALADKRELPVVEILAADASHDLAIVRIETTPLPALALGHSDALRPGDPVVAIGHPLGLEDTVSNGLVSAIRKIDDGSTVLQISAPIAPGSSGGPIFNDHGEVVGIATAIVTAGQNLNFGVPIDDLKPLMATPSPMPVSRFLELVANQERRLPPVRRSVPHHPVALLDGCPDAALALIVSTIGEAIEIGAPLYNGGNFPACFHIYEGAAVDLSRKLPPSCKGPAKALAEGRNRAATLSSASDQAWAMRDAFDGLLEVVERASRGR